MKIDQCLWSCLIFVNFFSWVKCGGGPTKCNSPSPVSGSNCQFDTNVGIIDLSSLDSNPGPRFKDIKGSGSDKFSYNPCTKYNDVSAEAIVDNCNGVSSCQWHGDEMTGIYLYPVGTHDTATCKESATDQVLIEYSATDPDDQQERITQIILVCDSSTEGQLVWNEENPTATFVFHLSSKYVCGGSGGLSFGSILCIILLVTVLVYLLGGALFMYCHRGARGIEIIPNLSFWKDVPYLVKDGGVFVVQQIKGKGKSYGEI